MNSDNGEGDEACESVVTMLPYKIRKPVYSGASKHFLPEKKSAANRTASDSDADQLEQLARDDPRLIGGNLQKAILLDLIDLREHFFERENSNSTINSAASASPQPVGTSFGRFKATFRDRRFGAIHTRTAPRNVDRGEYAQLLYSCCFYLLEESVADDDEVNAQKHKFNLPKSIFAIFTLYALHQTNPLPISPPTRQCTPKTNYNYSQDDYALREAWSALPISREEQNLYRKCYKSPVRIDRKNYLLLLQLSDVCKSILAERGIDSNESSTHFGMAQDASYIIDKMLFNNNFFSYCEYHGPCGLEGLAGNPHFYKEHFIKQKKKSKKGKSSKNGICTGLLASSQLSHDKLEKMKNDEHLTEILNVSVLSDAINKHKLNLQNITAQLQKSRLPGGDLQPKQREVVENTLSGVINSHQAYLNMATELIRKHTLEASGDGDNNNVVKISEAKESDRNEGLPLVFPESFSSELQGNIREALADFSNEVAFIRNSVMDEFRASNTPKDAFVIDTSNSIVVGEQGDRSGGQTISDILAFFDVQSETSDALEVNDKVDMEDEISIATGAGKNTLETLLKMAQNKMDTGQLDDDSASSEDSKSVAGTAIDDNSVATGSGIQALQNLLSQTTGGSAKQPAKRPAKSAKSKALSSSGRPNRQKAKRATKKTNLEDDISVATGAGKNALSSLLKMAEDDVASEDGSVSTSSQEQKSVDDVTNDDNSVAATGMKALQNLISQTTDTTHNQTPKRKKSPTKPTKSRAAPSTSRQKRQKTKKESKQTQQRDNDGEVSMNYTRTATSLSEIDDISVASTTAAGKDALAALLSQVENVEEV